MLKSKLSDFWNGSVLFIYRRFGRELIPYAIVATLIGIFTSVIGQFRQVSLGLIVESLTGEEGQSSAFPFADLLLSDVLQDRIFQLVLIAVAVYIVRLVLSVVRTYLWSKYTQNLENELRVATYDAIQEMRPKRFVQESTGTYADVVTSDSTNLTRLPRSVVSSLSSNVAKVGTIGVVLLTLNWQLAILTLLPIPIIIWWTPKYGDLIKEMYSDQYEVRSSVLGRITSSIQGIFTVKSYSAEDRETKRVESESKEYRDKKIETSFWSDIYSKVFDISSEVSNLIVIAIGSFWVLNGPPLFFTEPLTVAEWTVFYANSTILLRPARIISSQVSTYNKTKASADRVYSIIQQGDNDSEIDKPDMKNIKGRINYDSVEFTYDFQDSSPLNNEDKNEDNNEESNEEEDKEDNDESEDDSFSIGEITCQIDNGETIGIVGKTGSGKSTFIKLLVDFIESDTGSIQIDGKDISDYNPRSVRDNIGYVSQDPYLFNSSIRDNVMYGQPNATEDDVLRAVDEASLNDVIDSFDDGLDTEVGRDGSQLSGGQKQRVALARALVTDPDILVLDEATSHVDNITENDIRESIHSTDEDRTMLIIAHRLSTVREADRIFVFNDGQIVEKGCHKELVSLEGIYEELWSNHIGR